MDMPIISGDQTALNNAMNRCMTSRYMNEDFDKAWDRQGQEGCFVDPEYPNTIWSEKKTSNASKRGESSLFSGPEGFGNDILAEAIGISEIGTDEVEVAQKLQDTTVMVEVQSQNQQLPNPLIFPVPKAEIDEFASLENLANKSPDFTEIETVTTSFTINIPSKEIQLVQPTQKPQKPGK